MYYDDMYKKEKIKMLECVDYLEIHSNDEYDRAMFYECLQYQMEEEAFEAGEEIISATQEINHIYFMFQGFAEVEITVNDEVHKMDILRSKDLFGQYKMLESSKAYFSVTALSPVVILKLKQEFLKANFTKIVGVRESY